MKIHLNEMAQGLLFGYLEGVDWQIDLSKPDPNDKSDNPKDILLPEVEQNKIKDKVLTWIADYRKKYNGKFSEMEVDSEMSFYLTNNSDLQSGLIETEVFGGDAEDIFEDYFCYATNRERTRIKKGKENLHAEYKLAYKQLNKLSKLKIKDKPLN